MSRMPIALFYNGQSAEPIAARLAAAGFHAEVHDDTNLHKLWYAKKGECGVRIEVPSPEFERAEQMLIDWHKAEGCFPGAICCPECRSLRVEFPQHTDKSALPNLVVGALAAVGQVHKQFYCRDCHATWLKDGDVAEKPKAHSAPNYFIEDVPSPR